MSMVFFFFVSLNLNNNIYIYIFFFPVPILFWDSNIICKMYLFKTMVKRSCIIFGQNLPNNTIFKIFQLDSMRLNLFSKSDFFWKSILVNSTSRRIQPLIQHVNKFDLYCTWKLSSAYLTFRCSTLLQNWFFVGSQVC